ncbi:methyltransferase domain-containing protein [Salinibacter altiplanensis]|uniref:methyltransferase domain-containing protein n=1 Tax=Salinibacter altiplanensis TaxID=1803181 RepID=UPI000C9F3CDD|nr:methyltransferase domain-containing protein [Salinibacter altiplanensis]
MSEPATYSYPRYLEAKRTVDARALNRRVWSRFVDELAARDSSPVRVLEVGGGVGATVERIVEALASRSVDNLDYTFVDLESKNVEAARTGLRTWAEGRGYSVSDGTPQVWTDGPITVTVRFAAADLFDVAASHEGPPHDALVAQAVLDLLHIPDALGALAPLLAPGGLWYLPIHFDGVTAFEPRVNPDLDARVERLFHESMADPSLEGERAGAHCGRRLLRHLHNSDAPLLEAGSSDWVVVPQDGAYPGDEAYFLHHILHFIETELTGHPELDAEAFANWVATRRQQVETGELIYIAHQLDVLARSP